MRSDYLYEKDSYSSNNNRVKEARQQWLLRALYWEENGPKAHSNRKMQVEAVFQ
ncbi:MAG: hypothetical protein LV471_02295 [Nitrosomonas sp.]|nr:hypothetical protein [Nitrosomonas sp.]